ncbi:MAG: stage III sporulation protein AD [Oscillospiraceae bacterium]|nr:stage III sporulation protein AD [Oscillospiraceae bacterium]
MDIFMISAAACIGTVFAVLLKGTKPELSIGICIITCLILIFSCVDGIKSVFSDFAGIIEMSGIDMKYFNVVIKVIGIAYITQFAAEICRDSGQGSIALKTELAGKVCVLVLTMPIIKGFLELVINVLNWR